MTYFVPTNPKHRSCEKEKTRKLRQSSWWKSKLQEGICYYCQEHFPPDKLTMDHKVPIVRGGYSTRNNIVSSCKECNSRKKHMTSVEMTSVEMTDCKS